MTGGGRAAVLALVLATAVAAAGGQGPLELAPEPSAAPAAAGSGVKLLTLERALALAEAQNRNVQRALEYRRWVHGKYVEERAAALPHLRFDAALGRRYDARQQDFFRDLPGELGAVFAFRQDVASLDFGLEQVIYAWGQVGAAIRAARAGFRYADDEIRRARQDSRRAVAAAFYDVLLARELEVIGRELLDQRQRVLDEAERRHAAGVATDFDVLAARVAVENARPELIRAGNDVRAARDVLRFLLAEEGEIDVVGQLGASPAPVPADDQVLARALARRPEIDSLEQQRRVAAELVKVANAGDRPRLDLRAAWGYGGIRVTDLDSSGQTWDAGLYLSFPFLDGLKTRGQVAQARSTLASVEIERARLRDTVTLEVRRAMDRLREAAEIVAASTGTVTEAERLLFLAEKGFELGVKTNLEVKDAQLSLLQARGNLARAERDYQVALVNLEWVQGSLGD